MNFININVKSYYTLLGSLLSPKEIVDFAANNNSFYAAICDEKMMFGVPEFLKRCKERKVKPVVGIEFESELGNIALFAKNFEGYQRLMHHSSVMSLTGKMDQFINADFQNIVLVHSGAVKPSWKFSDHFLNADIVWHKSLYYSPEQEKAIKAMKNISEGSHIEINELKMGGTQNLLTPMQIEKKYSKTILANTQRFLSLLKLEIPAFKNNIYKFKIPPSTSPENYLETLCMNGLSQMLDTDKIPNKYLNRLNYELEIICTKGFEDYFLILWDVVKWAKSKNIYIGPGRGSAAGSLVSFALGITTVDPIKFNLFFERFLNPERMSMPDIDIDIEDIEREKVIDYMFKKYGPNHVCHITTFSTMKIKTALRDVGRILQIPIKEIDAICKAVPLADMSVEQAIKSSPLLQIKSLDHSELFEITKEIINCPRQVGTHAAGIILCEGQLTKRIPLQKGLNNTTMSQYSMEYLEELGLIKMDFLGLRNLGILKEIVNKIEKHKKIKIDLNKLPLNDKKTYKLLREANTSGIFQLESQGMRAVLRDIEPTNLEDISATSALFRPGPQDNIPEFIRRKNNKDNIDYIHKSLKDILKSTYGIIVYQEQVMNIGAKVARFSLGKSDILRRAMAKKDLDKMESLKSEFIKGAIENGYSEAKAREIFEYVERFALYGFNKSHSIAYAIIGYWLAYLKANYPLEFMASLLSSVVGNDKKTAEYIMESKKYGIKILPPSINHSFHKFAIEKSALRFPLLGLKSFGQSALIKLVEDRMNKPYKSYFRTIVRLSSNGVNSKAIESLIWSGALDEIGVNRTEGFKNLSIAMNYKDIVYNKTKKTINFDLMPEPNLVHEKSDEELETINEKEVLGFNLKYQKIALFKEKLDLKGVEYSNLSDVLHGELNKYYKIFVNIDKIKKKTTKTGSNMAFITISDETAITTAVAFSGVWKMIEDLSEKQVRLLQVKKNKISLVIEDVVKVGE